MRISPSSSASRAPQVAWDRVQLVLAWRQAVDVPHDRPEHQLAGTVPLALHGLSRTLTWVGGSAKGRRRQGLTTARRPLLVGVCYLPPEGSHALRHDSVEDRADAVIATVLTATQSAILLAGDFNAHTTPSCNARGTQLLDVCGSRTAGHDRPAAW